jgi:hypothetical protein
MRLLVAVLALLLSSASVSSAGLITFEWSGTINQQIDFDPGLVGQAISGTYTIDDTGSGSVQSITADFAGNSFTVSQPGDQSLTVDPAFYFVGLAPGVGTFNGASIETGAVIFGGPVALIGSGPGALPDLSVPGATPLIGTFQVLGNPEQPAVGALITEVRYAKGGETAIPEPVSAILFAVGGLVVGGAVRRKLD